MKLLLLAPVVAIAAFVAGRALDASNRRGTPILGLAAVALGATVCAAAALLLLTQG